MKKLRIILLALLLMAGSAVIAPPATAGHKWEHVTEGPYTLKTFNGLCVDVDGMSRAEGAKVHQWQCHGQASQLWYRVRYSYWTQGVYYLRNLNSGLCIEPLYAWTNPGRGMVQWRCYWDAGEDSGQYQQLWRFQPTGGLDRTWFLNNFHNGNNLDVPNNSNQNGVQLIQWTPNSGAAQIFFY